MNWPYGLNLLALQGLSSEAGSPDWKQLGGPSCFPRTWTPSTPGYQHPPDVLPWFVLSTITSSALSSSVSVTLNLACSCCAFLQVLGTAW